jgi:flagellar L-ring protein precursor FlgH
VCISTKTDLRVVRLLVAGQAERRVELPLTAQEQRLFHIVREAVRVTEVLPNGHMMLEGRRMTLVGGEEQEAVLRGVVRQEDIQPGNTVLSYNVADASIKFVSKGSVTDSQRRGWFTRAFDKITPF